MREESKDNRSGKLDAKSDEDIFLGYSTKRKAYKCLNSNTNKVVESANVEVDENIEKNEVECKIEPKKYSSTVLQTLHLNKKSKLQILSILGMSSCNCQLLRSRLRVLRKREIMSRHR